jgi:hypothetical protein
MIVAPKEKGRLAADSPIPKMVLPQEQPEHNVLQRHLQASRLVRLYAVNAAMAEAIAPLVFLEVMR